MVSGITASRNPREPGATGRNRPPCSAYDLLLRGRRLSQGLGALATEESSRGPVWISGPGPAPSSMSLPRLDRVAHERLRSHGRIAQGRAQNDNPAAMALERVQPVPCRLRETILRPVNRDSRPGVIRRSIASSPARCPPFIRTARGAKLEQRLALPRHVRIRVAGDRPVEQRRGLGKVRGEAVDQRQQARL